MHEFVRCVVRHNERRRYFSMDVYDFDDIYCCLGKHSSMKLLVTEVNAFVEDESFEIVISGRKADGERRRVRVSGYEPHIFGPETEVREQETALLNDSNVSSIEYDTDKESLFGEQVAKIIVKDPSESKELGVWFSKSYRADLWSSDAFRIDAGVKSWVHLPDEPQCQLEDVEPLSEEEQPDEDPKPRICTFDIETDDRAEGFPELGEERILSIAAHNSESDDYVGFIDLHGRSLSEAFPDGRPEELDALKCFRSEKRMLNSFAEYIDDTDPDLLAGWNSTEFDIPFLIKRMKTVGADYRRLSPFGLVWVRRGGTPVIKGRSPYDLLKAYKRNSKNELDSFRLDAVAQEELGSSKISHDEGFFEMYESDPTRFMNYNARDTRLTVGINREAEVTQFRDALRKLVGVDWEATLEANDFIEMQTRRKLKSEGLVGPTATHESGESYEGGFVLEPFSGIADNVMEIDLSSLYPMTMKMLNLSPEVKSPCVDDTYKAANGVCFSKEKDGLFRKLVDDIMEISDRYKERRQSSETREKHKKWSMFYDASKAIRNAAYGVLGWKHFFLYDRDTAEAIALTAQSGVKTAAKYVKSEGLEVLYGDTDSIYIKFDDGWEPEKCINASHEIVEHLNDVVYPNKVPDFNVESTECYWEMEAESFSERFFQAGKKKRYAKLLVWDDGKFLDEPEYKISGFGSQRSDSSDLLRETEETVIHQLLDGVDDTEIVKTVFDAASRVNPESPDFDLLGMPQGIGQPLDSYEIPTAHVRGAKVSNNVLGTTFGDGSKPKRIYVKATRLDGYDGSVDVVCYDEPHDLEPIKNEITVDASKMIEKTLRKPLSRILDPVGISTDAALRGQQQTGLAAF